ncbi:MAG: phosphoserine phosphatase SerB, partial [Pseudomonadota bacterium]|nr:phosphoserine phosphatase SerB [Pseudomonadota bacterium]
MHQTAIFSSSAHADVTPDAAIGILASAAIKADSADVRILAEGRAVEITLADMPVGSGTGADDETAASPLAAQLRAAGDALRIDVNLVPRDNRGKRLLIADMDSTVITTESLDDMSRIAGLAEDILPITERAMRGELDFEQALDARLALLAGQPAQLVDDALEMAELTPGAITLVRTMRAA